MMKSIAMNALGDPPLLNLDHKLPLCPPISNTGTPSLRSREWSELAIGTLTNGACLFAHTAGSNPQLQLETTTKKKEQNVPPVGYGGASINNPPTGLRHQTTSNPTLKGNLLQATASLDTGIFAPLFRRVVNRLASLGSHASFRSDPESDGSAGSGPALGARPTPGSAPPGAKNPVHDETRLEEPESCAGSLRYQPEWILNTISDDEDDAYFQTLANNLLHSLPGCSRDGLTRSSRVLGDLESGAELGHLHPSKACRDIETATEATEVLAHGEKGTGKPTECEKSLKLEPGTVHSRNTVEGPPHRTASPLVKAEQPEGVSRLGSIGKGCTFFGDPPQASFNTLTDPFGGIFGLAGGVQRPPSCTESGSSSVKAHPVPAEPPRKKGGRNPPCPSTTAGSSFQGQVEPMHPYPLLLPLRLRNPSGEVAATTVEVNHSRFTRTPLPLKRKRRMASIKSYFKLSRTRAHLPEGSGAQLEGALPHPALSDAQGVGRGRAPSMFFRRG